MKLTNEETIGNGKQKGGETMKLNEMKVKATMADQLLTAKKLVVLTGLSEPTVLKAISGDGCRTETAGKIAKALGVKTIEIM